MSTTNLTTAAHEPFAERVAGLKGSPIDDLDTLLAGHDDLVPLAGGTPHRDDIPVQLLAELACESIRDCPPILNYGLSRGDAELRGQLQAHAPGALEGDVAEAELIVTSGALQAIDIVARLFLDPGDLVLVESPTFSDALATFSGYEPLIVEAPADEEGMAVDDLEALVATVGRVPKLIYTIPTFQNPAGTELSLERRNALLDLAERWGSIVVDDDPYRLLRYDGDPVPSLRALSAGRASVVCTRSSSKLIAPGLRVGWAFADPRVISQMVKAKQGMDVCTSNVNQRVVARFLERGLLDRRIEDLKRDYAERLRAIVGALEEAFGDTGVRWRIPRGGYFLWLTLDGHRSAQKLLHLAVEEGVSFVPGPAFSPSGRFDDGLRLCFAAAQPAALQEGVRRLRRAYDRLPEVHS